MSSLKNNHKLNNLVKIEKYQITLGYLRMDVVWKFLVHLHTFVVIRMIFRLSMMYQEDNSVTIVGSLSIDSTNHSKTLIGQQYLVPNRKPKCSTADVSYKYVIFVNSPMWMLVDDWHFLTTFPISPSFLIWVHCLIFMFLLLSCNLYWQADGNPMKYKSVDSGFIHSLQFCPMPKVLMLKIGYVDAPNFRQNNVNLRVEKYLFTSWMRWDCMAKFHHNLISKTMKWLTLLTYF